MWIINGLVCCLVFLQLAEVVVPYHLRQDTEAHNFLDSDDDGNIDDDADAEMEDDFGGGGGRHRQTPQRTPDFVTLGQKYSVAIGSTIVLPCKINDSELFDHYVLAWKRDIAVLTAGNVKVTMNPRIRLMPHQHQHSGSQSSVSAVTHKGNVGGAGSSYNLEIQNVRPSDAGEYACQLGTLVPKEIVHSLEVLVPPKINFLSPTNKLEVSKGTSIKLECRAIGNPKPVITWTRKNNVLPNGEANITNNVLEMMHADRHTVGQYKCTADNRVGEPDQREVSVNVLYAPEIEVERPFVHTGIGYETQLICIVHAEPNPHIIWYKGSTQLGVTEQHSQQNRGNRFALDIRNVTIADLGNYTCQASNSLGKDRQTLTVSGIPSICEIVESPRISNYHDQYNISWTVESFEPIFEYRLLYRLQANASNRMPYGKLAREKKTSAVASDSVSASSSSSSSSAGGSSGLHYQTTKIAPVHPVDYQTDWRSIIIVPQPSLYDGRDAGFGGSHYHSSSVSSSSGGGGEHHMRGSSAMSGGLSPLSASLGSVLPPLRHVVNSGNGGQWNANGRQKMSYMMTNLRTASNYEVRVQARNTHGWNRLSTTFHFTTGEFVVDDNAIPSGADFRPLTLQSSSTSTSAAAASVHSVNSFGRSISSISIVCISMMATIVATSLPFLRALCMRSAQQQQQKLQQQLAR